MSYHDSDFAQNLNMLCGTVANLRMDSPALLTAERWDFVLETLGETVWKAGMDENWLLASHLLGVTTDFLCVEDTPKSLLVRLRETRMAMRR